MNCRSTAPTSYPVIFHKSGAFRIFVVSKSQTECLDPAPRFCLDATCTTIRSATGREGLCTATHARSTSFETAAERSKAVQIYGVYFALVEALHRRWPFRASVALTSEPVSRRAHHRAARMPFQLGTSAYLILLPS